MFALYIAHPQVMIDPAVPVPQWGLSSIGVERARQAARCPWAASLSQIVSSDERKAIETANILAAASGCEVVVDPSTGEIDRSSTGYLPHDEHEAAADGFFANPNASFGGWERAVDAQARIVDAVARMLADHDPARPIAFVGHGGVGTLLKCHIAGLPIGRDRDQPPGGGNLFCFSLASSLAECRLACDWTPMEFWQGEMA